MAIIRHAQVLPRVGDELSRIRSKLFLLSVIADESLEGEELAEFQKSIAESLAKTWEDRDE